MNLALTKWQTDMLEVFFDIAKTELDMGKPGILLAQITKNSDGTASMAVAYAEHETAIKLQEVTGIDKGKMTAAEVLVFYPLNDES